MSESKVLGDMRTLVSERRSVMDEAKQKKLADPIKLLSKRCSALDEFMSHVEELIADESNLGVQRIKVLLEAELPWCTEMFEAFVKDMMERVQPVAAAAAEASLVAELELDTACSPTLQPDVVLSKVVVVFIVVCYRVCVSCVSCACYCELHGSRLPQLMYFIWFVNIMCTLSLLSVRVCL